MANRSSNATTSSSGSDSMFVKDPKPDELATPLSPPKAVNQAASSLSPATASGSAASSSTKAGGGTGAQVSRWSHSTTDGDRADGTLSAGSRLSTNTTGSGDSSQLDQGRWSEGTFGDPVRMATAVSVRAGMAPTVQYVVSSQSLAELEANITKNQGADAVALMKSSSESAKLRRQTDE